MAKWTAADLPDQSGRTYVVTGANSGIGLQAAKELGRAGAHVVLAVRTPDKGRAAIAGAPGSFDVRELDLASLDSVRAFAAGLDGGVDVLVNNAGVMAVPQGRTADGFELQIGTNHLGHFALTNLLLDRVTSRVVTVSSTAHKPGKVDLDDLNWKTRPYDRWQAYCQSKLANLLFSLELDRRLAEAGSDVLVVNAHPGYSSTNLQSRTGNVLQDVLMKVGNLVIAQSDERGAWPTLYAATQDVPRNAFVGPDGLQEMRGHPTLVGRTGRAQDAEVARRLWDLSEELTGVTSGLAARA